MGDFNEVRNEQEKKGCSYRSRIMDEFDQWINDMELIDLPLSGRKFTWRRGSSCSKLDCFVVDP